MKKVVFKGCATALVTPFTNDGINFEELRKLIEFQILEGVDGLVICGTTGESSTMTLEEKREEFTTSLAATEEVKQKLARVEKNAGERETKPEKEMLPTDIII